MSQKFLFVNSGTEPIVIEERFAEGNWTKTVVQPGDHKLIALWGGKQVNVVGTEPQVRVQSDVYGARYGSRG